MNICKDCAFYRRTFWDWLRKRPAKCAHYSVCDNVTGKAVTACATVRARGDGGDYCGHMGNFFKSKKMPVIIEADVGIK